MHTHRSDVVEVVAAAVVVEEAEYVCRNNVIGCVGADVTEIAAVAGKPSHRGRRRLTRGSRTRYHNTYTIIERISSKTVRTTSVHGARVFLYFVGIPLGRRPAAVIYNIKNDILAL